MTVTFRPGVAADAPAISAFARRVFEQTFGPDNDPADMAIYANMAFAPSVQLAELTNPARHYLLGEVDGVLAAYALMRVGTTEPCVDGPNPVEIERFYVDHAWHGQGLAAGLMQAALEHARALGGETVWLGVWDRNARAIRFYEKHGFRDVGSHGFQLGNDLQTDRIMMRSLTEPAAP